MALVKLLERDQLFGKEMMDLQRPCPYQYLTSQLHKNRIPEIVVETDICLNSLDRNIGVVPQIVFESDICLNKWDRLEGWEGLEGLNRLDRLEGLEELNRVHLLKGLDLQCRDHIAFCIDSSYYPAYRTALLQFSQDCLS